MPDMKALELRATVELGVSPLNFYHEKRGSKPLQVPGVLPEHTQHVTEAVIILYSLYHKWPTLSELERYIGGPDGLVPSHVLDKILNSEVFHRILQNRGLNPDRIKNPDGSISDVSKTLTPQQMLALSALSDVSKARPLELRLKSLGISWSEWQLWMKNPVFKTAHDNLAREIFTRAQSTVDIQVVSGALEGRIDFIKYYNEITGRYDPARKTQADISNILRTIVDIITRHVTDEQTLAKIGTEFQVLVKEYGLDT